MRSGTSSKVVVVDLGASVIRAGLAGDGAPSLTVSTPTSNTAILSTLVDVIGKVRSAHGGNEVVVGCPGLIDLDGIVQKALYIDLSGFELGGRLGRLLGLAVKVVNDANLQAYGLLGDYRDALFVSVGTAVGGAVLANGDVVLGHRGFAGEIGHIPLPGLTEKCPCGNVGCLDTVASGIVLARRLGHEWWRFSESEQIDDVLSEAGHHVGAAAALLSTMLDPEAIVVAGHVVGHRAFSRSLSNSFLAAGGAAELRLFLDTWQLAAAGARQVVQR
jgi:predicted NBD/HSP70 family sugar kinase